MDNDIESKVKNFGRGSEKKLSLPGGNEPQTKQFEERLKDVSSQETFPPENEIDAVRAKIHTLTGQKDDEGSLGQNVDVATGDVLEDRNEEERFTRRKAMEKGLKLGLGGIAWAAGINALNWIRGNNDRRGPFERTPERMPYTAEQVPDVEMERIPQRDMSFYNLLFPNLENLGEEAQDALATEVEKYRNDYLQKERVVIDEIISKRDPVIQEVVENIKGIDDERKVFLRKALGGIIFAESRNVENPSEDEDVVGLCQVKTGTAGLSREALLHPETNIKAAAEYLNTLCNTIPDRALALWAYNIGEGNIAYFMGNYLNALDSKTPEMIEDIQEMLDKNSEARVNLIEKYINNGMVDFYTLVSSSTVDNVIKSEIDEEETSGYVYRVAGAALAAEQRTAEMKLG